MRPDCHPANFNKTANHSEHTTGEDAKQRPKGERYCCSYISQARSSTWITQSLMAPLSFNSHFYCSIADETLTKLCFPDLSISYSSTDSHRSQTFLDLHIYETLQVIKILAHVELNPSNILKCYMLQVSLLQLAKFAYLLVAYEFYKACLQKYSPSPECDHFYAALKQPFNHTKSFVNRLQLITKYIRSNNFECRKPATKLLHKSLLQRVSDQI